MTRKPYSELLKDPRWQKKRLEILNRDGFKCQSCEDETSMLVVHHLFYEPAKDPWDCPDEALITLCENCHANERDRRPEVEQILLYTLRDFLVDDLESFAEALALGAVKMERCTRSDGTIELFYPNLERALERVEGWEGREIDAVMRERAPVGQEPNQADPIREQWAQWIKVYLANRREM